MKMAFLGRQLSLVATIYSARLRTESSVSTLVAGIVESRKAEDAARLAKVHEVESFKSIKGEACGVWLENCFTLCVKLLWTHRLFWD
jgi:hypothetical protein